MNEQRKDILAVLAEGEITAEKAEQVNVRVPLQLLRAGVQLAALIPAQVLERANAELNKAGVPVDLTQLKPQQLEALVEHLGEMTGEVDDANAKIGFKNQTLSDLQQAIGLAEGEQQTALQHQFLAEKRDFIQIAVGKNRLRKSELETKKQLLEAVALDPLDVCGPHPEPPCGLAHGHRPAVAVQPAAQLDHLALPLP